MVKKGTVVVIPVTNPETHPGISNSRGHSQGNVTKAPERLHEGRRNSEHPSITLCLISGETEAWRDFLDLP
jgi:hypothetical protein